MVRFMVPADQQLELLQQLRSVARQHPDALIEQVHWKRTVRTVQYRLSHGSVQKHVAGSGFDLKESARLCPAINLPAWTYLNVKNPSLTRQVGLAVTAGYSATFSEPLSAAAVVIGSLLVIGSGLTGYLYWQLSWSVHHRQLRPLRRAERLCRIGAVVAGLAALYGNVSGTVNPAQWSAAQWVLSALPVTLLVAGHQRVRGMPCTWKPPIRHARGAAATRPVL